MKPLSYLLLLLLAPLLLGACKKDDPEELSSEIRRTVLVYVAGQNSLAYNGEQTRDSLEIVQGLAHLAPNDRLLLFIDDQNTPRIYEMAKGYAAPKRVRTWSEDVNSADAQTLTDVLRWTKAHYPAQEYGLVLWSHATGWIYGQRSLTNNYTTLPATSTLPTQRKRKPLSFGIDVGPDGNMARDKAADGKEPYEMDIEDLAKAIEESGLHFRYILFDCCLMQGIEVGYALRHTADYIAGSPISISAEGGYYTDLMQNGFFAQDIRQLGEAYMKYYREGRSDMGMVFSIVRTDRLEALAKTLAEVLPEKTMNAETNTTQYWNMSQTLQYAAYARNFFYRPHYFDMEEALRKVLPENHFDRLKSAIDQAIVYKGTTPRFWAGPGTWQYHNVDADHYCGVSMFVPQAIYTTYATAGIHGDHNLNFRRTEWYKAAGWEAKGW